MLNEIQAQENCEKKSIKKIRFPCCLLKTFISSQANQAWHFKERTKAYNKYIYVYVNIQIERAAATRRNERKKPEQTVAVVFYVHVVDSADDEYNKDLSDDEQ